MRTALIIVLLSIVAVSAMTVESDARCTAIKGSCVQVSAGCGGTWHTGLCDGATSRCCVHSSSAPSPPSTPSTPSTPSSGGSDLDRAKAAAHKGDCPGYEGATTTAIVGNGGKTFHVTKIHADDLTDPSAFNDAADESDNTFLLTTGCAFARLKTFAATVGFKLTINSGFRTLKRQQYFWHCHITKACNNGNLAAHPGTSNHGLGLALDFQDAYPFMKKYGTIFGFIRTVPTETWHWEYRVSGTTWPKAPSWQ